MDIVLCHTRAFYKDLSRFSPEDRRADGGAGTYGYAEFRRDVTAYIMQLYNNVKAGEKALNVPGANSGRRNADVLIAFEFRRYHNFKSWQTSDTTKASASSPLAAR